MPMSRCDSPCHGIGVLYKSNSAVNMAVATAGGQLHFEVVAATRNFDRQWTSLTAAAQRAKLAWSAHAVMRLSPLAI